MENKSGKIIAIVALAIAVVALSVGFAAFADTLTITNASATANASDASSVFDNVTNGLAYTQTANESPKCVLTDGGGAVTGVNAGTFTDADTWANISVPLGNTATSVTCTATVTNSSAYIAYLTELSTSTGLSCSSTGNNASQNETNVCAATTVTVSINDGSHTDTMTIPVGNSGASATTHATTISANGGTATVSVVIAYSGATTDQDTTITIPTITHNYSSAPAS